MAGKQVCMSTSLYARALTSCQADITGAANANVLKLWILLNCMQNSCGNVAKRWVKRWVNVGLTHREDAATGEEKEQLGALASQLTALHEGLGAPTHTPCPSIMLFS